MGGISTKQFERPPGVWRATFNPEAVIRYHVKAFQDEIKKLISLATGLDFEYLIREGERDFNQHAFEVTSSGLSSKGNGRRGIKFVSDPAVQRAISELVDEAVKRAPEADKKYAKEYGLRRFRLVTEQYQNWGSSQ